MRLLKMIWCLILVMGVCVFGQHPYETIWSKLVSDHTIIKKSKSISYVYVDYDSMVKSQNFSLLLRVCKRLPIDSMTKSEKIAFLINYYNIKMVETVFLDRSMDNPFFNETRDSLRSLDERSLFGLTSDTIYSPNLIAFFSSTIFEQLDVHIKNTLPKFVRYDRSVNILYVEKWVDRQPFSTTFKGSLFEKLAKDYDKLPSYHYSDFGNTSNSIKK